jgi:hypothetical protein
MGHEEVKQDQIRIEFVASRHDLARLLWLRASSNHWSKLMLAMFAFWATAVLEESLEKIKSRADAGDASSCGRNTHARARGQCNEHPLNQRVPADCGSAALESTSALMKF